MDFRRLTLFAGHYGSGKTNVAINWARMLRQAAAGEVCIADLDIVNPYFRTKDSAEGLRAEGIGLVVSDYANSNVDFPALPKEIYAVVADPAVRVVMDIGGDDRGALALGRYAPDIRAEGNYEMLAVLNFSRPLTRTAAEAADVLREIEQAGGIPFTGLVNNTNLGLQTTAETVLDSMERAEEASRLTGLPLRFTCAEESVADALTGKVENLFPLRIQRLYYQVLNGNNSKER